MVKLWANPATMAKGASTFGVSVAFSPDDGAKLTVRKKKKKEEGGPATEEEEEEVTWDLLTGSKA